MTRHPLCEYRLPQTPTEGAHTVTITVEQLVTVTAAAVAGALTSYATARALWK